MSNITEEEHWRERAISFNHQVLKYYPLDVHSNFLILKKLYKAMKKKQTNNNNKKTLKGAMKFYPRILKQRTGFF